MVSRSFRNDATLPVTVFIGPPDSRAPGRREGRLPGEIDRQERRAGGTGKPAEQAGRSGAFPRRIPPAHHAAGWSLTGLLRSSFLTAASRPRMSEDAAISFWAA